MGANAARENGIFDRLIRALGATYCDEDHAPILRSLLTDGVTLRGNVFVDWYVRWILGEGEEQSGDACGEYVGGKDGDTAQVTGSWAK